MKSVAQIVIVPIQHYVISAFQMSDLLPECVFERSSAVHFCLDHGVGRPANQPIDGVYENVWSLGRNE
ncbi:MAG: hypothetical protein AAF978_08945, partial [Cyanobacteria bacterium P01_E01_bin.48]